MTTEELSELLRAFSSERAWGAFHSPENLVKSIAIEAGEPLECFQWQGDADIRRVREELADVLTYCLLLTSTLGVSVEEIVLEKLEITRAKYPIEEAYGRSTRYDER